MRLWRFAKGDSRALKLLILFLYRFRVRLDRLRILDKGDSRENSLISSILFYSRLRVRLDRLRRFAKGQTNN